MGRDHAQVAMARFAGMNEKGRAAGARERCGDFSRDMPGFAHSRDHDPASTGQTDFAGFDEIGADRAKKTADRIGFDVHDDPGPVYGPFRD
jgi:hypothetical protein